MFLPVRMKELRIKKGLTQHAAAEILDISTSSYIKYERGERKPNINLLTIIAQKFDVSLDYLLGNTNEENKYVYTILKSGQFASDREFLKSFGKYEEAVTKMAAHYSSSLYDLDFNFLLDIFYMSITIQDAIQQIHYTGMKIFCYEDLKPIASPPDDSSLLELNKLVADLRHLVDQYLYLLQTPDFYHPNNDYFFAKEILNFDKKNTVTPNNKNG